ncbi:acyltransferase family protein [Aerococcaceae bacterium DSM 109653]|uniref:Acyltransferase family protein n=1 Tax=Fundicoccus ignavus TaxID=2664442 RepID=A0A844BRW8_9LACT|nr:acyltransferase family protein [Fundicoccus ignavus]
MFLKKIVKIYLPFLFVELLSLPLWNNISFKKIFLDFTLIKPVSSFAWYMNYLMVCYILFYCVMIAKERKRLTDKNVLGLFLFLFVVWFVLESTILVNPDIPILKSRQMLSFVFGIYLAMKKIKNIPLNIGIVNIVIGIGMMVTTQIPTVKSLSFISYNLLSLGTVFPLAIGGVSITNRCKHLFKNKLLIFISIISYELYLIHQYSIYIFMEVSGIKAVVIFLSITIIFACLLYQISNVVSKKIIK